LKTEDILELAEQFRVSFGLGIAGKLKVRGGQEQVNRLAPIIQEHKAQLLEHLQNEEQRKEPFLDDQGRLRIPLDAADKYKWWAGGQSVFETLLELEASSQEIEAHIGPIETPEEWIKWQAMKAESRYAGFRGGLSS